MSHPYAGTPRSRKGITQLRRLGVRLRFESTLEERVLLLLDASPEVAKVERAEPVPFYLPDGTEVRSYTPDFTVTLQDTQQYSLECKPAALLKPILEGDEAGWQTKDVRLSGLGRPLRFVTERDCPVTWLEQAKTFMPFVGVEPDPTVQRHTETILGERKVMPLADLRDSLRTVLPEHAEAVDSTVYGMLARSELVSDVNADLPVCRVALPGGPLTPPRAPLGLLYKDALARVHAEAPSGSADVLPGLPAWQRAYEDSERGQRYRTLFSLYSDPTVPLSEDQAAELGREAGLSARSVYRFRDALLRAGAPGLTFSDVVPYLTTAGAGRPRRQISPQVQAIIEATSKEHYFLPPGQTGRLGSIASLHEEVARRARNEELEAPSPNTVKRYIALIERRDPVEAARLRFGREAAQKLEARQGRLEVYRYGELIAIDCSPCDVFVQDNGDLVLVRRRSGRGKGQGAGRGQPYRPTLVMVVEVATSQVLRVAALPGAARAADILRVLREVFLGDTATLEAAGVTVFPQAKGLPVAIRMDAGTEFVNRQVERALKDLGIQVLPRAKWNRHFGGVEESTIKVFTHAHHALPGTSMNNILKRGEHDTQKLAVLSLEDVDRFNQQMLERHNSLVRAPSVLTRQQHAQHLIDTGLSVWRPLSETQREYVTTRLFPEVICKCGRDGVQLLGLTYTAAALNPLIVGERTVRVSYEPDDLSEAYVIHPDTGEHLRVTAQFPDGIEGPLSLHEWDEIKREYRRAEKAAKGRVKTHAQLAQEVVGERKPHRKKGQRSAKVRTVKSLKPRIEETPDARTTIKPADIAFEPNPFED